MTAMPLFPTEDERVPPDRCPHDGQHMTKVSFVFAYCPECGWQWARSAQIAADEPWPEDVL